MKKIILSVAVLVTVASCSKTDETAINSPVDKIEFSTLNDRVMSRAANDDSADYTVYAVHDESTSAWFIADEELLGSDNSSVSSNAYYWPSTGSVDFYAFAPSSVVESATATTGLTAEYTIADATAAKVDLTSAQTPDKSANTVTLNFKHMLSKVVIDVVLADELKTGYTIAEGYTASLGVNDIAATANFIDGTMGASSGDAATYTGALDYNIIPEQVTAGCSVKINDLVINSISGKNVFSGDLYTYVITGEETNMGTAFTANTKYLFTITVTSEAIGGTGDPIFGDQILFDAKQVAWGDASVDVNAPTATVNQ